MANKNINISISEDEYNRIYNQARQENLTIDEFLLKTFRDKYRDYSGLANILIKDTELFNYQGGHSAAYNKFAEQGIKTLQELFEKYDARKVYYGNDKMASNGNSYIHSEIEGIIKLLRYKYLGIEPDNLKEVLNHKINANYTVRPDRKDYGFPGVVFNAIYRNNRIYSEISSSFNELYKILKMCGYNQTGTKALIDIAYSKQVNNISLGEFLANIDMEEARHTFSKVSNEYSVFLNTTVIILDYYKKYGLDTENNKILKR